MQSCVLRAPCSPGHVSRRQTASRQPLGEAAAQEHGASQAGECFHRFVPILRAAAPGLSWLPLQGFQGTSSTAATAADAKLQQHSISPPVISPRISLRPLVPKAMLINQQKRRCCTFCELNQRILPVVEGPAVSQTAAHPMGPADCLLCMPLSCNPAALSPCSAKATLILEVFHGHGEGRAM